MQIHIVALGETLFSISSRYGVDASIRPVNSLKLFLPEAGEHRIATLIEVSPVGQAKARVLSPSSIQYEDSILTLPSL